jgi:hypothetical protein
LGVRLPFGARKVPPQPRFSTAGSNAAAMLPSRLLALRAALDRHLPVLWLRAKLLCKPRRWAERTETVLAGVFDRIGRAVEALSFQAVRAAIRTIKWRRVALVASAPFVLPKEFRAATVRILAYLGAIGALSVIAAEIVKQPSLVAMVETRTRPAWLDVDRPWPAFQLSVPGFGEGDTHYAIRRHAAGGGRRDMLSFGELGKTQRYLSFDIYRAGQEAGDFGSDAESVRELAGEHGRVTGMRGSMPIPSKFGPFQTFDFAIGPFNGYTCIGFMRTFHTQRVQIGGLSCNMNLLIDRSAISCALDRLTLMSAGSDPEIARLFAQAELKRSFCGQREHILYATPKRPGDVTSSLEPKPRLRGRFVK